MAEPDPTATLAAVRAYMDEGVLYVPDSLVQQVAFLLRYRVPVFIDSNLNEVEGRGTLVAYTDVHLLVAKMESEEGNVKITTEVVARKALTVIRTGSSVDARSARTVEHPQWPTGVEIGADYAGLSQTLALPVGRGRRSREALWRLLPTLLDDLDDLDA